MATPSFASSEFLVGECARCEKQVLTHVTFTSAGDEIRCCLHCDAVITAEALRWMDGDELESAGYGLIEARTCGNGGGCSAGGCGTRH